MSQPTRRSQFLQRRLNFRQSIRFHFELLRLLFPLFFFFPISLLGLSACLPQLLFLASSVFGIWVESFPTSMFQGPLLSSLHIEFHWSASFQSTLQLVYWAMLCAGFQQARSKLWATCSVVACFATKTTCGNGLATTFPFHWTGELECEDIQSSTSIYGNTEYNWVNLYL